MNDKKINNSSTKLFEKAKKVMPGGVSSPVRSFKAVEGSPVFIEKGKGSKIYDKTGKQYIDYSLSWGPLILGHTPEKIVEGIKETVERGTSFGTTTELEIELAQLIVNAVSSIEQVRFTNSGTEAVMGAVRLARGYTEKDKIIKFEGAYHGHADYLLSKVGSGATTFGSPDSLGVPKEFAKQTIVLPYNDIRKVKKVVKKYHKEIAAIIVEPVVGNSGVILPKKEFLEELRKITNEYGLILIFDEVITGFRLSYGGAQQYFGIKPDITCLGKIIGGGLPIGAFGAKKEIMNFLSPKGKVYQAGTLSGNPISVVAGINTLKILRDNKPYELLEIATHRLCKGIKQKAKNSNIQLVVNYIGSMFSIFFSPKKKIANYKEATSQDTDLFSKFHHKLLQKGVYFSPSGFESNFLSTAHTVDDVNKTLEIISKVFSELSNR